MQMALVNTVAFRGVWQKQFQFTNTQNLPFTLSDGSAIKVPMMYQATEVSFGKWCQPASQSSIKIEHIERRLLTLIEAKIHIVSLIA